MVRPSMTRFFRRGKVKFSPEVTPGVCPHCAETTSFMSIVNDFYKCMSCGEDVEQKVNGVIKYMKVNKDTKFEAPSRPVHD